MISALIFDFDGLILDTEKSEFVSWQEMYAEHQVQLLLEEWAVCIGAGADTFDPYTHLETLLRRPIAREEIRQRRLQRRMAMLAEELLLPGVEEYLQTARHLRLKLGVASSSSRAWVEGHLERLGILHYFDVIRCRDDVQYAKPDPELYLSALAGLEVQAEQAIALEDSPNGVRAAQRAGIFCVAIPNVITSQLPLDHADLRLTSMAAIPLEELIALVEQRRATV
jgi:HAD superfamily hydrolase (TIGR01509 family)